MSVLLMLAIATSPILLVFGAISSVFTFRKVQHKIDIFLEGSWLGEEQQLLALAHLRENPDDWSIKKGFARFPKGGNMAKITIQKDNDTGYYAFEMDDDKSTIKRGYVYNILEKEINILRQEQQYKKVAAILYPDGVPLLIESSRHKKEKEPFRTDFFTQASFLESRYQDVFSTAGGTK